MILKTSSINFSVEEKKLTSQATLDSHYVIMKSAFFLGALILFFLTSCNRELKMEKGMTKGGSYQKIAHFNYFPQINHPEE